MLSRIGFASLHAIASELVHRLRGQPQMRAHGNIARAEVGDALQNVTRAFEFDHGRAGLRHRARRLIKRHARFRVSGEGHVDDQHRAPQAPRHGRAVVDHVIQTHGQSGAMPLDDVTQRVADQHHVHALLVENTREACVIRGQRDDLVAALLLRPQAAHRDR